MIAALANHLWQSTLFAAAAGVAAVLLPAGSGSTGVTACPGPWRWSLTAPVNKRQGVQSY